MEVIMIKNSYGLKLSTFYKNENIFNSRKEFFFEVNGRNIYEEKQTKKRLMQNILIAVGYLFFLITFLIYYNLINTNEPKELLIGIILSLLVCLIIVVILDFCFIRNRFLKNFSFRDNKKCYLCLENKPSYYLYLKNIFSENITCISCNKVYKNPYRQMSIILSISLLIIIAIVGSLMIRNIIISEKPIYYLITTVSLGILIMQLSPVIISINYYCRKKFEIIKK